ncbi:MAG: sigma-70 family RNA polymerase sigma factor [Candidatus Firestonebacteria bacterium]
MGLKELKKRKDAENMADLALVHRFNLGEEQAFFELVNKYKTPVAGIVYKFIGDKNEIEDVSQEVFLQLYKSLSTFKGRSRFFTWLYRVVFNVCMYYKRGKASKKPSVSFDKVEQVLGLPDIQSAPEELLEGKNALESIRASVEKLPEDLKTAFVLREMEGLSYREIAVITGVSKGTVKSRIHNSRIYIAKELIKQGEV